MIPSEQKNIIKNRIQERVGTLECPMCHKHQFILLDGYFTENIQEDYKSIVIGNGNILPTIGIACINCGYVARFALGALGLLPDETHDNRKGNENNESSNVSAD